MCSINSNVAKLNRRQGTRRQVMYNKDREGTTLCSTIQARYHKLKQRTSKIPQTYKLEGNADIKATENQQFQQGMPMVKIKHLMVYLLFRSVCTR